MYISALTGKNNTDVVNELEKVIKVYVDELYEIERKFVQIKKLDFRKNSAFKNVHIHSICFPNNSILFSKKLTNYESNFLENVPKNQL